MGDAVTAWLRKPLHLKSRVRSQHHPRYNYFSQFCYSAAGNRLSDLLPLLLPDLAALQTAAPHTLRPPRSAVVPRLLPLSPPAGQPAGHEVLLYLHSLVKRTSPAQGLSLSLLEGGPWGRRLSLLPPPVPTHTRSVPPHRWQHQQPRGWLGAQPPPKLLFPLTTIVTTG